MKQNVTNNASKNPLSMARHFDSWQKKSPTIYLASIVPLTKLNPRTYVF